MWAELEKAELAYHRGRYSEAEGILKKVCRPLFNKDQWGVTSNLLACQAAGAKVSGNMRGLSTCYVKVAALLDVVQGVPATDDSIATELTVVCFYGQLQLLLTLCGQASPSSILHYLTTMCLRFCRYLDICSSEFPQCLSLLHHRLCQCGEVAKGKQLLQACTAVALSGVLSQSYEGRSILAEVGKLLTGTVPSEVDTLLVATDVKESLQMQTMELTYYKAWRLYQDGCYSQCMESLDTLAMSSGCSHTRAAADLLVGNCLVKMGKSNLALCCYHQCLSRHSDVGLLPALHNVVHVLRHSGDSHAEMESRQLYLKSLKADSSSTHFIIWRDCNRQWSHSIVGQRSLSIATFSTALRALELNRPELAASLLSELMATPSTHCDPAVTHLLLVKSLLLAKQFEEAIKICHQLIHTLEPHAHLKQCSAQYTLLLHLATGYTFGSMAALYMNHFHTAIQLGQRSVQVVNWLLENDADKTLGKFTSNLLFTALCALSLVFVGKGENDTALQLLTNVVAIGNNLPIVLVYNYCLLKAKNGQLSAVRDFWLKERKLLPAQNARLNKIREITASRKTLNVGSKMYMYNTMDLMMLKQ